jgi:hypothetical protein
VGTLLYAGQFISVVDFPLAQRLGLQENPEAADPLASWLELMTARWDIVLLWIPPVAGLLLLLDHAWWPPAYLIAGGVYMDTGGREWAKIQGLATQGVPIGSAKETLVMKVTYGFFIVTGIAGVVLAFADLM